MLNQELGKTMSTQEIADFLDTDVKTVRKYYRELGGIRLGRHYKFFEKEVCNAIQNWKEVEGSSEERRVKERENLQYEKGGDRVGGQNAETIRKRLEGEDRHGLFG